MQPPSIIPSSAYFSQTPPPFVSLSTLYTSAPPCFLICPILCPRIFFHTFFSLPIQKPEMTRNPHFLFFLSLSFICFFSSHFNVLSATSAITAVLRDQAACTMCSACNNPCQPILPPPPPSPPLPSPPPPSDSSNCPPPPSPPSSENYYYSPPPPQQLPPSVPTFMYYSPPPPSPSGGGEFYPPPNGYNFPTPPPPNPIVPYFPFYYYNPPPSGFVSKSVRLAENSVISSALLFILTLFYIFW